MYGAFSHDVTAAILVFQNNKTAAMLGFQTNPVGVEFFSYVNAFFCSHKFAQMLATRVKTLYKTFSSVQQILRTLYVLPTEGFFLSVAICMQSIPKFKNADDFREEKDETKRKQCSR